MMTPRYMCASNILQQGSSVYTALQTRSKSYMMQVQRAMQASLLDLHCQSASQWSDCKHQHQGNNQQATNQQQTRRQAKQVEPVTTVSGSISECAPNTSDTPVAAETPTSSQSATERLDNSATAAAQLDEAVQLSFKRESSTGHGSNSSGASCHAHAGPATAAKQRQSPALPKGTVPAGCQDVQVLARALAHQLSTPSFASSTQAAGVTTNVVEHDGSALSLMWGFQVTEFAL